MGLEALFDQQLDRKGVHLEDEEFDAVQDFLDRPVSPNVQEKLAKTMAREYPWEQQKLGSENRFRMRFSCLSVCCARCCPIGRAPE